MFALLRHAVRHDTIVAAACDNACLLHNSREAKETSGPKDKIYLLLVYSEARFYQGLIPLMRLEPQRSCYLNSPNTRGLRPKPMSLWVHLYPSHNMTLSKFSEKSRPHYNPGRCFLLLLAFCFVFLAYPSLVIPPLLYTRTWCTG